jgi:hypothetical protein
MASQFKRLNFSMVIISNWNFMIDFAIFTIYLDTDLLFMSVLKIPNMQLPYLIPQVAAIIF